MRVFGLAVGLWLSLGVAHASGDACPSITELTSGISKAVAEAELEQAGALAAQSKQAALCQQQPLQTMLLAQLFRMSGAAYYFNGDMAGATSSLTLAASISPGEDLEALFGAPASKFYSGIRDQVVANGGASIVLKGEAEAWIDGRALRVGVPRDITAGPHILQTREAGGAIQSRELTLASGEDHVLQLGATTAAAAPAPAPAEPVQSPAAAPAATTSGSISKNTMMLGGGGALVATGAVMLFLASQSHRDFDNETDASRLPGLQSKTNSMATAGLVSGVAGLGLVGAGTMLSGDSYGLLIRGRW